MQKNLLFGLFVVMFIVAVYMILKYVPF